MPGSKPNVRSEVSYTEAALTPSNILAGRRQGAFPPTNPLASLGALIWEEPHTGQYRAMPRRSPLIPRPVPIALGALTLLAVAVLLLWDVAPGLFPASSHAVLGALPLGLIAIAYLTYQGYRRPLRRELLKAVLLALAFAFWATNQALPNLAQATLFNDLAIALFVLDVFLVLVGWPAGVSGEDFAETATDG